MFMNVQRGRFQDIALLIAGILSAGLQFRTAPPGVQMALPPVFLAILTRLLPAAELAAVLSSGIILAYGIHAALLPRLSDLFFHCRRPGLWAGSLAGGAKSWSGNA